jgi:hypothetical protein
MFQQRGWQRRLGKEREAISRYLSAQRGSRLQAEDVDGYDWDWARRYEGEVLTELQFSYAAALSAAEFMETPLTPAQTLASHYARQRAGEMLRLGDRNSVVDFTRQAVRDLVAQTIEEGQSIPWLRRQLRDAFAFSDARAETIARTETAQAQGRATLQAYQSLGHEGKRWIAEASADANADSTPCLDNQAQGAIAVGRPFNSGHSAPPAHPNGAATSAQRSAHRRTRRRGPHCGGAGDQRCR